MTQNLAFAHTWEFQPTKISAPACMELWFLLWRSESEGRNENGVSCHVRLWHDLLCRQDTLYKDKHYKVIRSDLNVGPLNWKNKYYAEGVHKRKGRLHNWNARQAILSSCDLQNWNLWEMLVVRAFELISFICGLHNFDWWNLPSMNKLFPFQSTDEWESFTNVQGFFVFLTHKLYLTNIDLTHFLLGQKHSVAFSKKWWWSHRSFPGLRLFLAFSSFYPHLDSACSTVHKKSKSKVMSHSRETFYVLTPWLRLLSVKHKLPYVFSCCL